MFEMITNQISNHNSTSFKIIKISIFLRQPTYPAPCLGYPGGFPRGLVGYGRVWLGLVRSGRVWSLEVLVHNLIAWLCILYQIITPQQQQQHQHQQQQQQQQQHDKEEEEDDGDDDDDNDDDDDKD